MDDWIFDPEQKRYVNLPAEWRLTIPDGSKSVEVLPVQREAFELPPTGFAPLTIPE